VNILRSDKADYNLLSGSAEEELVNGRVDGASSPSALLLEFLLSGKSTMLSSVS
jgi:hypothetical protein